MAGFHDIIGHEKIKEHLQKAIGYQRVSHAYILSGEEGMGRKTIAKAFAMTLLCEKHGTEQVLAPSILKILLGSAGSATKDSYAASNKRIASCSFA